MDLLCLPPAPLTLDPLCWAPLNSVSHLLRGETLDQNTSCWPFPVLQISIILRFPLDQDVINKLMTLNRRLLKLQYWDFKLLRCKYILFSPSIRRYFLLVTLSLFIQPPFSPCLLLSFSSHSFLSSSLPAFLPSSFNPCLSSLSGE